MNSFLKRGIQHCGKVPLCNGVKSRAPFVGRFCFPLCWRCFGLVVGSLVGYWIGFSGVIVLVRNVLGIFLLTPLVVDGLLQEIFVVESTNFRRVIFGVLFGIGLHAFYV